MKKNGTLFLVLFIFLLPMIVAIIIGVYEGITGNYDYTHITDVYYKAVVDDSIGSNGRIHITERLTFDIHAASINNTFWELWRELPESTIDGVDVRYKVKSVKQIFDDGTFIYYDEAPKAYYYDSDYLNTYSGLGPNKWFHSPGPYNEENELYESLMIYIDGVYRDTMTFEIEYDMYNAALRYGDCSELYLSMYSGDTINYLKHYKSEILFPNNIMPRKDNYTVHTLGTNSNSFPYTESTTLYPGYTTFSMELNKEDLNFKPYNQYVEFTLVAFGDDKYAFTKNASINNYYYDNVLDEVNDEINYYQNLPETYHKIKVVIFAICIISVYFIIKKPYKVIKKIKEKYTFYNSNYQGYYRDIPGNVDPLFAAHIAFIKDKTNRDMKDIYAALLLSLARKKYVELIKVNPSQDWTAKNTKIIIKHEPIESTQTINSTPSDENGHIINITKEDNYEELTPNEKEYFNLILRHCGRSKEITLDTFQLQISYDYSRTDYFVNSLEKSKVEIGVNQGYYQNANYTEVRDKLKRRKTGSIIKAVLFGIIVNLYTIQTRIDFAYSGFLLVSIANIICAVKYSEALKHSILLTQFGEDECSKWRGLYEFLNSETLMKERTIIELPIWEQYLVYATAFGISQKVIKAIQIRCPEIANQSPILNTHSAYHSRHFYHTSRSIRTTSHTASSFSHSGGYGGYGGGGRGGGGGGGGH